MFRNLLNLSTTGVIHQRETLSLHPFFTSFLIRELTQKIKVLAFFYMHPLIKEYVASFDFLWCSTHAPVDHYYHFTNTPQQVLKGCKTECCHTFDVDRVLQFLPSQRWLPAHTAYSHEAFYILHLYFSQQQAHCISLLKPFSFLKCKIY